MGIFKIAFFVIAPITGLSYTAFSLGKQLPKACRKMGNYIGLSYIYFKCFLKVMKPQDRLSYDMIDIVRKASQQSQALRRQLRNTMKKAKKDFQEKNQEIISTLESQNNYKVQTSMSTERVEASNKEQQKKQFESGGHVLADLEKIRSQIMQKKENKSKARKFFDQL